MLNFFVVVVVFLSAVALLLGAVLLFKKYGWPMKYLWAIPVMVLFGLGVWWGISSLGSSTPPTASSSSGWSLEAPAPGKVWEFFKNYWLWVVLILAIPFCVLFAFKTIWAKAGQGVIVVLAVILVGALIVHGIWGDEKSGSQPVNSRSEVPLASSPQSSWPKLVIPAGGKSEVIPLPSGMRVMWAGYQFRNYTVYPDGHECAFNGTTPCPDGGTGTYANNEVNVVNVVAYAFAPID